MARRFRRLRPSGAAPRRLPTQGKCLLRSGASGAAAKSRTGSRRMCVPDRAMAFERENASLDGGRGQVRKNLARFLYMKPMIHLRY